MNINILRYSLFGIAGGQEVDRNSFFKSQNIKFFCDIDKVLSKFRLE